MGRAFADLTGPKPFIINIDHHITNTRFGDINVVDPQAASTTEILYKLFSEMQVEISPDIALALLTGLVTDTLGFRTNNVNANTLHAAADLVEAGADLGFVTMHALNLRSLSTLELWRTGMNNMQIDQGLIWTTITKGERRAANFRSNSSVGLVNLLADVDQVSMGAVLMEMDDDTVKVGLRCRPPYDVSEIAIAFGGGGHALAAGCTISGPLAKAEAVIVRACQEAIARQSQPVVSLEASP
jgi:phosphoesterase RecJ-like protein